MHVRFILLPKDHRLLEKDQHGIPSHMEHNVPRTMAPKPAEPRLEWQALGGQRRPRQEDAVAQQSPLAFLLLALLPRKVLPHVHTHEQETDDCKAASPVPANTEGKVSARQLCDWCVLTSQTTSQGIYI